MGEVPLDDADGPAALRESHFKLLCDGSNVVYIEAMILIFQCALK